MHESSLCVCIHVRKPTATWGFDNGIGGYPVPSEGYYFTWLNGKDVRGFRARSTSVEGDVMRSSLLHRFCGCCGGTKDRGCASEEPEEKSTWRSHLRFKGMILYSEDEV